MADLNALLGQLIQGQIDLQNHIAALVAAQPQLAPPARKKVVADPGSFDGSPAKFHEWWSKLKVWIDITMEGANDATVAAAVYSQLTGPKAGRWAQVRLNQCMAAHAALVAAPPLAPGAPPLPPAWPTRQALEAEIEGFFLPGNNQEWARAQLLRLRQGSRQRIDEFLAQFEALKIQSRCVDDYARDLLERALQRKLLEQVYVQNMPRDTYVTLSASAKEIGRAQELFLINTQSQSPARYYQGQNYSSSSASASGTPMDIGAADTSSQQRGKGPQFYNCQLFGHIARECTKLRRPRRGQQQAQAAQAQPEDDRLNAVRGMSFAEMQAFFRDLKD